MKTAVVLFNLGGPDSLEAVQPFLFNLFHDRAIIGLPQPLRYLVAKLISTRRAPIAKEIYAQMGGKSPLNEQTFAQANALDAALGEGFKSFVCMRYWHPMSAEVAKQVKAYDPDRIILLPLYPQFSTTTTNSSWKNWGVAARKAGLNAPTQLLCCYPENEDFANAQAELIKEKMAAVKDTSKPLRLLFSAHGLPEKIVKGGDPYQWQVEQSVKAVMNALIRMEPEAKNHEVQVCYQSRVGPLQWIGPSTDDELKRAGEDGVNVVLTPIAFVSEHSETLVELDIEYGHLAKESGVAEYLRVPTVQTHPTFIAGLAKLVKGANGHTSCMGPNNTRCCPEECRKCPCKPNT